MGGNDAPADTLDFSKSLVASPSPPGNLKPQDAPQLVVFGWDDIENDAGVMFINSLLAGINNPNGSKASANVNPNACYGEGWSTPGKYACGDGSLSTDRQVVTSAGFTMGNHTIDHLEPSSTWPGIPAQYKSDTNGWVTSPDGFGPGVLIDQPTWKAVILANDAELKSVYGAKTVQGFRAPRLEINDNGLKAIKEVGYTYDQSLEETLPDGFIDAAVAVDTAAKKGFNWVAWPYTLDNGSPGVWSQQANGDRTYIKDFPSGLWEFPTYAIYVPTSLGTTIANAMMAADKDCTFPAGTPPDQQVHCYLSDGELNPGDAIKEVTGFDFNAFVYSRMTPDQWLTVMQHTFLLHYYGNRAPMAYGGHPIEYTDPYDSYTLSMQANNYGYRNVLKYSTYQTRQQAMVKFVQWIKNDPTLSKDTYFLSAAQAVDFMQHPFDKTGKAVTADTVASPDSNGLFSKLGWTGTGATITVVDGNSADIVFNVKSLDDDPVHVAAGLTPGALANVSHIDLSYSTEVPFRIRLLTTDGTVSTTVLLAGTGADRLARIRIKDFFPGPESTASEVSAAGLVDAAYMKKVSGIVFESAATQATGAKTFNTHIKQITLHGVSSADLCKN